MRFLTTTTCRQNRSHRGQHQKNEDPASRLGNRRDTARDRRLCSIPPSQEHSVELRLVDDSVGQIIHPAIRRRCGGLAPIQQDQVQVALLDKPVAAVFPADRLNDPDSDALIAIFHEPCPIRRQRKEIMRCKPADDCSPTGVEQPRASCRSRRASLGRPRSIRGRACSARTRCRA